MPTDTTREKPIQVRIYPADMAIVAKIQAHTGINSRSQLVRASLRAYLRELDRSADVVANPRRTAEG